MSDDVHCAWCGEPLGPNQIRFCKEKCADDFAAAEWFESRQRASAGSFTVVGRKCDARGGAHWTKEETEKLRHLLAASNLSASHAALALAKEFHRPFTRNMVIGKCWRIGIRLNPDPRHILTSAQVLEIRKSKSTESSAALARRLGVSASSVCGVRNGRSYSGKRQKISEPTPNPFPDASSCLWGYGDPKSPSFHFCGGRQIPGMPYCATHAAVCYVPDKPKVPA